ncbi:MAG: signal recognition particle-docking protein FtsY [bacterium]
MFEKLKSGIARTRNALAEGFGSLVGRHNTIGDDFFDDLEATLLLADVGLPTARKIIAAVRENLARTKTKTPETAVETAKNAIAAMLAPGTPPAAPQLPGGFSVILFAGVNGSGKTTTIAKLAHRLKGEGRSVMMAACDTFRAAAADQLEVWAKRIGVPIVRQSEGADPSAVIFDAIASARAKNAGFLLADTAGRLHTKVNLMEELRKIRRVATGKAGAERILSWLVLDATLGQNSLNQVRLFNEAVPLDAIVLTKLDGTAGGGAILSILDEWKIPIAFLGVGEGLDDLVPFHPDEFARALLEPMKPPGGGQPARTAAPHD